MEAGCQILSIHSHIFHRFPGNQAPMFPLWVLGFQINPMNYLHWKGHMLNSESCITA